MTGLSLCCIRSTDYANVLELTVSYFFSRASLKCIIVKLCDSRINQQWQSTVPRSGDLLCETCISNRNQPSINNANLYSLCKCMYMYLILCKFRSQKWRKIETIWHFAIIASNGGKSVIRVSPSALYNLNLCNTSSIYGDTGFSSAIFQTTDINWANVETGQVFLM